jgi:hypothetical protein
MMSVSKILRIALPLALAGTLGLSACSKERTPEEPTNYSEGDNQSDEQPEAPRSLPPEVVNEPAPANVADATPVDTTSQDQQMQEDADASGMTSRLPPPDQTIATSGTTSDGDKPK